MLDNCIFIKMPPNQLTSPLEKPDHLKSWSNRIHNKVLKDLLKNGTSPELYFQCSHKKINIFDGLEKNLVIPLKNPSKLRIKSTVIDLSRSQMVWIKYSTNSFPNKKIVI